MHSEYYVTCYSLQLYIQSNVSIQGEGMQPPEVKG